MALYKLHREYFEAGWDIGQYVVGGREIQEEVSSMPHGVIRNLTWQSRSIQTDKA